MRRKIFLILSLIWMAVIFVFSNKTGTESAKTSHKVDIELGKKLISGFKKKSAKKKKEFVKKIDTMVRKLAHIAEYAILGFLLMGTFYDERQNHRKTFLISWISAIIYAASDEFHQLFVPDRSGRISDVVIDSIGAGFGILGFILILFIISRYSNRRKSARLTDNK